MTLTRQNVTDVTARLLSPSTKAELARIAPAPVRQEPRTLFTRCVPADAIATELQTLVNEHSHHLCVCSPNREEMLRARAEMQAHPGYAEYKARRDAAMGPHRGARD